MSGMDILKNAFSVIYSNFQAVIKKGGYRAPTSKELAKMTKYNESLFTDNGRAPILLVGLKNSVMQKIFDTHVDESASMSIKTQRKLRSEALTYLVENKKSLQKLKIFKDFEIIFPSVSKEMGKKKNFKK